MELIIKPILNPIAFEIFQFQIRWYGILMSVSLLFGSLAFTIMTLKTEVKDDDERYIE